MVDDSLFDKLQVKVTFFHDTHTHTHTRISELFNLEHNIHTR